MAKFIQSLITVIVYMKWNLINIIHIYYCNGGKEKNSLWTKDPTEMFIEGDLSWNLREKKILERCSLHQRKIICKTLSWGCVCHVHEILIEKVNQGKAFV